MGRSVFTLSWQIKYLFFIQWLEKKDKQQPKNDRHVERSQQRGDQPRGRQLLKNDQLRGRPLKGDRLKEKPLPKSVLHVEKRQLLRNDQRVEKQQRRSAQHAESEVDNTKTKAPHDQN